MTPLEFRSALTRLNYRQCDLARLLDVTPRAVNMWARGDRKVPGPVVAWLRLVESLPVHKRPWWQWKKAPSAEMKAAIEYYDSLSPEERDREYPVVGHLQ